MQLWYSGDLVTIELFYWYTSTETGARVAMRVLYALAALVQAETGMEAFDPQLDVPVGEDYLDQAVARYRGVGEQARRLEDKPRA